LDRLPTNPRSIPPTEPLVTLGECRRLSLDMTACICRARARSVPGSTPQRRMNAGLDLLCRSGRMLYAYRLALFTYEPELYAYSAVPVRLYPVRPPYAYAPFRYTYTYAPYVPLYMYKPCTCTPRRTCTRHSCTRTRSCTP